METKFYDTTVEWLLGFVPLIFISRRPECIFAESQKQVKNAETQTGFKRITCLIH